MTYFCSLLILSLPVFLYGMNQSQTQSMLIDTLNSSEHLLVASQNNTQMSLLCPYLPRVLQALILDYVDSWEIDQQFKAEKSGISQLTITNDNHTIAASSRSSMKVHFFRFINNKYDLLQAEEAYQKTADRGYRYTDALAQVNNTLVLGGYAGDLVSYRLKESKYQPIGYLSRETGQAVRWITCSSDGNWIASIAENETIEVFKTNPFSKQVILPPFERSTNMRVGLSKDGTCLAAAAEGYVALWQLRNDKYELLQSIELPDRKKETYTRFARSGGDVHTQDFYYWDETAESLALSPDGLLLIVAYSKGTIRIWRVEDHKLVLFQTISSEKMTDAGFPSWDFLHCIALSSDKKYFITNTKRDCLNIWQWAKGSYALRNQHAISKENITSLNFSPDGKYIVTGSSMGTVCRWKNQIHELA